jgi:hypothetical protein
MDYAWGYVDLNIKYWCLDYAWVCVDLFALRYGYDFKLLFKI